MAEVDVVKSRHKKGIVGILQSYGLINMLCSIPAVSTFLFSISFIVFLCFSPSINIYDVLVHLSDLSLTIFPNLLGFSLGGYALIIGFGNTALLKSMTKTKNETDQTIFQRMNGIFAFGLLLQVFELLFAFIVKFIVAIGSSSTIPFFLNHLLVCQIINLFGCFMLTLCASWSLAIIPYIVSNVFLFGQMHHLYLTKERIIEDRRKEAAKQNEA
jgi:hypothetical protein